MSGTKPTLKLLREEVADDFEEKFTTVENRLESLIKVNERLKEDLEKLIEACGMDRHDYRRFRLVGELPTQQMKVNDRLDSMISKLDQVLKANQDE
jgi:hypothetical protein